MKKVLFYTTNGMGLGHLRRAQLLAGELKNKDKNVEISLITSAVYPEIFGSFFNHLIRLDPLNDDLMKSPSKTLSTRLENGDRLEKGVRKIRPDLIVVDFHLSSPFNFSPLNHIHSLGIFPDKSIFIWRVKEIKKIISDIKKEKDKLNYFRKIIIPYSLMEIKQFFLDEAVQKIEDSPRFEICNPIFKKIDKKKISDCRLKYGIKRNSYVITITLGGGGASKESNCESGEKIIKNFLKIYPSLSRKIAGLKVVVVGGPYLNQRYESLDHLRFIDFEENLLELMRASDLVISTAGYNTCNELIESKAPSILVPLIRDGQEQFERANFLRENGISESIENISSDKLFRTVIKCKDNLKKMTASFRNFSKWGHNKNNSVDIILDLLKNH